MKGDLATHPKILDLTGANTHFVETFVTKRNSFITLTPDQLCGRTGVSDESGDDCRVSQKSRFSEFSKILKFLSQPVGAWSPDGIRLSVPSDVQFRSVQGQIS